MLFALWAQIGLRNQLLKPYGPSLLMNIEEWEYIWHLILKRPRGLYDVGHLIFKASPVYLDFQLVLNQKTLTRGRTNNFSKIILP